MPYKRPRAKGEDLLLAVSRILVPEELLRDFDLTGVEERPGEYVIELTEKADRIPGALQGKGAVEDGYCNSVSIMTNAFALKKIYLEIYRRRWKEPGKDTHYSNDYDLHLPGMKTTKAFSAFLKEINR